MLCLRDPVDKNVVLENRFYLLSRVITPGEPDAGAIASLMAFYDFLRSFLSLLDSSLLLLSLLECFLLFGERDLLRFLGMLKCNVFKL